MIDWPKRSLNAPRLLGILFGQDTGLETREGLLARGLARVRTDELGVVALARVLRAVDHSVAVSRLGPMVAPVQGELTHDRGRTAVAVSLAHRLLAIRRARFVTLVRVAGLVAAAGTCAVFTRAGTFGHPTNTVAAFVRAVFGTTTSVFVLGLGAGAVSTRCRTVAGAAGSGLGRTADLVPTRRGAVIAAICRVLGLSAVVVAALLRAVGRALLARLALGRVTRAITAFGLTDATVRRARVTGLGRLAAGIVPALGRRRRTTVIRDVVTIVIESIAADFELRTRGVARSPASSRTLLATRRAGDHAQPIDGLIGFAVTVVIRVIALFLVLRVWTAGVDLLATTAAGFAIGLAHTLATLGGPGHVAVVRLAITVIVLTIAVAVSLAIPVITGNRRLGDHNTLAGAEDQTQAEHEQNIFHTAHRTPSKMQPSCVCLLPF